MKKIKNGLPLYQKADLIMKELDGGYHNRELDLYPPFAMAPWDDRNRYREYVRRVLERLERAGQL